MRIYIYVCCVLSPDLRMVKLQCFRFVFGFFLFSLNLYKIYLSNSKDIVFGIIYCAYVFVCVISFDSENGATFCIQYQCASEWEITTSTIKNNKCWLHKMFSSFFSCAFFSLFFCFLFVLLCSAFVCVCVCWMSHLISMQIQMQEDQRKEHVSHNTKCFD